MDLILNWVDGDAVGVGREQACAGAPELNLPHRIRMTSTRQIPAEAEGNLGWFALSY